VLEEVLDSIGVAYHRSATNFVTFAAPWAGLRPYLEEVGVSVRNGDDLGMPGWCRVTVGEPVQMVLVRRALRAWAEKGST
jgi:histidinol-phosphate/aromatic aminotransferase/cobyric acid decarboxylase-like protein